MTTILRLALAMGCLQAFAAGAGEIIILQPNPARDSQVIQVVPEGSERGSEKAMNRARREAGKTTPGTTIIITDDQAEATAADNAEESARSASDYLRPSGPPQGANAGGTVVIRSMPTTDADRARQRARAYVVPAGQQSARSRDCVAAVNNQVGTVGEGTGSAAGGVVERGSSNVNLQSYCR